MCYLKKKKENEKKKTRSRNENQVYILAVTEYLNRLAFNSESTRFE